jgi:hypothetical protein
MLARAAISPSSEEHCSHILPAHHEVQSVSIDHRSHAPSTTTNWVTHPEQDRVIQIMEQLV